ncbi:hypothetical protein M6B38_231335 [Iris pallida]|uniref:Secreted protein n=1 Tax=Iris pallida TaxID=29817 RepID=A0AAX6DR23_IRIPA|nr:hypothetical protein M6B38_231335 [Iris pallida]
MDTTMMCCWSRQRGVPTVGVAGLVLASRSSASLSVTRRGTVDGGGVMSNSGGGAVEVIPLVVVVRTADLR